MRLLTPSAGAALLAGGALLAACGGFGRRTVAPPGPLTPPERFSIRYREDAAPSATVLPVPFDRAWDVLPAVFEELGFPAAPASNAGEHVFITPYLRIAGRLYEGERNGMIADLLRLHARS